MKRSDIYSLRDEALQILDESDGDITVLEALETIKKSPSDLESYLILSEDAIEKNRFDQALAWIGQGLIHHPDHEALLLKKAALLLDAFEEVDEAFDILKNLDKRFKLNKNFDQEVVLDSYLLLTDCFRLKENYLQAFEHAKIAFEHAPHDEEALLAMATAYFEIGNYPKALELCEPISERKEKSDFYWLKGQIMCAMGDMAESDNAFLKANKIDKNRYYRPIRTSESCFFNAFEQASLALPKEIRDLMNEAAIEIKDIVPLDFILQSKGHLSPEACIYLQKIHDRPVIFLFQRNIENLSVKKSDLRDLIASALLHELGKLLTQ